MTVSEKIRSLASEGMSTADIARRLNIRYQHAYKVLRDAKTPRPTTSERPGKTTAPEKPPLRTDYLIRCGFEFSGHWQMTSDGQLCVDRPLPKEVGVYAFAAGDVVQYIGVATMGLAKRLYFYAKPGATQPTSQRVNALIKKMLISIPSIDVYTAKPVDLEWNGLPVHGSAGLELGLIKKFALPWNMRSAG